MKRPVMILGAIAAIAIFGGASDSEALTLEKGDHIGVIGNGLARHYGQGSPYNKQYICLIAQIIVSRSMPSNTKHTQIIRGRRRVSPPGRNRRCNRHICQPRK